MVEVAGEDFPESESWSDHEKEVTGKPVASRNSENSGNYKAGSRKWHIIFICHMEKVCSIVRQIYGLSPTDSLNDLQREQRYMEYIHACHTPSCSSSWSRLYEESTVYQESTPTVCETLIPSDCKVD